MPDGARRGRRRNEGDEETLRGQRERIEQLAREITPHGRVEFDAKKPNRISFRVIDNNTGTVLAASGEMHADQLADKPDEWVREYICHLSGGDI